MSEIRYQFLEHDCERVIMDKLAPKRVKNKVEVFTDGIHKLIFVDGVMLRYVLDIDLPQKFGEISPQITITLHPESVVIREIDAQQFKDMQAATHPGERIFPGADSQHLHNAIKANKAADEAAWKAEVLEQLKTISQAVISVTENGNAMRVTNTR